MATMIISSPPPVEDAMSASKVLGDEDLLGEILRRVDSPTSLVRAALVSKSWLHTASARDFVRCFCALHPPCRHLLGFYVTGDCVPRPEFVSMPALEPHDRELSAVLRQASNSVLEAFPEYSSRVWDCRDGRVLFDFTETVLGTRRFGVRHPDRGVSELPPMPSDWPDPEPQCPEAMLLPDDGNDDATCYRLRYRYSGPKVTALVGVLRSGVWTVHCAAEAVLAMAPDRIPLLTRLASGKLYMVAAALTWPPRASSSSTSPRAWRTSTTATLFPAGETALFCTSSISREIGSASGSAGSWISTAPASGC